LAEQKRKFGCLSIVALLFLIGVGVNAMNSFRSAPAPSEEQVQETQAALPEITLDAAIQQYENSNLTDFALANCSLFDGLDFDEANSVIKILPKLENVGTSREASDFLADNDVPNSGYGSFWASGFNDKVNALASSVGQKVDKTKYSIEGSWGQVLKASLIENCDQGETFSKLESDFRTLENEVNRVRSLYANLPWYPDGYELHDSNIAYKFNKSRGCDYLACFNLDVVTKISCSSLYVEMNVLDGSGSIIGFTNDSARNVSAGQVVKLRLDIVEDNASTGQITEMSCY